MIPLSDENPTLRTPVVTFAIITLNVAVWILVQGMGSEPALSRAVCELGLIPGELLHQIPPGTSFPVGPDSSCVLGYGESWYTPLTSMFLHGSWFHLLGNMWFLWLFGNNVEDSMGRLRYAAFYILCGLAAAGFQVFLTPGSAIPMVGASGAISGVMGAYLILYPRVRVYCIVPIGIFPISIALPAWTMLIYWAGLQMVSGLIGMMGAQDEGGVAFGAHVGGFFAGVVLIKLFARPADVDAKLRQHWEPRRVAARW
jgi:membrane associated rhomboid family serine protease